jgi:hypothetical protein
MPVLKVRVGSNNQGQITCPKCSKVKSINATHHLLTKKAIKVRCSCGHSFKVSLDYRHYFRKNVRLPATLYKPHSDDILSEVTLTSLSVSGIGFETTSLHDIYISSLFEIEFKLDDNSDTHIRETICIKRITGFVVGAEFTEQDKYCFELDFYLAPSTALD